MFIYMYVYVYIYICYILYIKQLNNNICECKFVRACMSVCVSVCRV